MSFIFNKEKFKFLTVIADQALMSIVSIIASIVFARCLPKDTFADYVLLLSITMFFLGFQRALITVPYSILLNDFAEHRQKEYFSASVHLKIYLSLLFSIVLLILKFIIDIDFKTLVFYEVFIFGYTLYFFLRELLLSQRKTIDVFFLGLIISLMLLVFLGVFYLNNSQEIGVYYYYACFTYSAVSIFYLIKEKSFIRIPKLKSYFFRNLKLGKWLLGTNTLFHIVNQMYPWLLLYFTEKSDIAILGVLLSVANLVNPFLKAMNAYIMPVFVRSNRDYLKLNNLVKRWLFLFMIIASSLVCVGYFFGETLIAIMFGDKYGGLSYFIIYPFINQALKIAFEPIRIAIQAIKRTDISFWILLGRSIVAFIFGVYFISNFGLLGVFYTQILESVIYNIVQVIIYKKLLTTNKVQ